MKGEPGSMTSRALIRERAQCWVFSPWPWPGWIGLFIVLATAPQAGRSAAPSPPRTSRLPLGHPVPPAPVGHPIQPAPRAEPAQQFMVNGHGPAITGRH